MKKVAIILVLLMVFSMLGLTKENELTVKAADSTTTIADSNTTIDDSTTTIADPNTTIADSTTRSLDLYQPKFAISNPITKSQGNILITAKDLNVRQGNSASSNIVSKVHNGDIYKILSSSKDSEGRVWYKINSEFGVTGWVAGWYCKKTKESINTAIESKPGKLFFECTKESLFIKLLLLEDYSLSQVLKVCGSKYTKNTEGYYVTYEYQDGTQIETNDGKEVIYIEVGGRNFNVSQIQKYKADLLSNQGNEIIIFTGDSFIILEAKTKKIIREYNLRNLYLGELKVGNFVGDSKVELFVSGYDDSGKMQNIYKIVNNSFVRCYDKNSFLDYVKGLKVMIEKNNLKLDINIGNYVASETSELPDRVFWNTKNVKDKNDLLSIDPEWTVMQENNTWYIKVRYKVNLVMLNYYWGPPGADVVDNEKMYNDLATVDILLNVHGKTPVMNEITHAIKYNDPTPKSVKPILFDEAVIVDGPKLGTSMEEAYKALGGKPQKEYSERMELNRVSLFEFCMEVVDILVESPEYETTRGLKVGDDISKVESLYGKPDIGFSGDSQVEYKFSYEDQNGQMCLDFYRTLTIYYKDGLVSAYGFTQVILD